MNAKSFVITKLQGYSGIRLKEDKPLAFKPGINLLVGRNGSGKSNLINLIHCITTDHGELKTRIESSFFVKCLENRSRKKSSSIEKSFGEVTIAEYSLKKQSGTIKLLLKSTPEEYVLNNLLQPAENFQGHIAIATQKIPIKFNWINSNQSSIKFEMSGYISTNILSRDHDNKAHKIMEGPIKSVSDFVRENINEFYRSEAFISKMDELEKSINSRFTKFFGNTKKRAKINYHEIDKSGRISLSLMDGENYIESSYISTGETVLLNLIFSLTSAKEERCEILCMDEPDIHMHDDMIQVLVDELSELSILVPEMIIVVASHSTAMIERVAVLGKDKVNVITFDHERNVSNDSRDIDLINALSHNGVKFSPLMLSRRTNIFIENQLLGGKEHRDFLLKFFPKDNMPNVIPIGTSGNVQDKKSFISVFEDILNVSNVRSMGIQDGDIWFKRHLTQYFDGKISMSSFINILSSNDRAYVSTPKFNNLFYFNFWEIENLYLVPELFDCWRDKKGNALDKNYFINFLIQNKRVIAKEYLKTYFKQVARINIDRKYTMTGIRQLIAKRQTYIDRAISDSNKVEEKVSLLIEALVERDLIGWFPGKEIKKALENAGFKFNDSRLDLENLSITKQIREILDQNDK